MAGPQEPAAARSDRLRAGRADRERVIETLKDAFAQDRLTIDELDTRTGLALTARTCAELAALTADIPAATPSARSAAPARRRRPTTARRRRPLVRAAAGSGACLGFAFGAVLFAANVLDPHGLGNPYHPWSTLCLFAALAAVFAAVCIALHGIGTSVEQRRSRRRLPTGPGGAEGEGQERSATARSPVLPGPHDDQASPAELRSHQPRRPRRQVAARPAPRSA